MADAFAPLIAALDAAPAPVAFWWRDDDATRPGPALDRLLDLAGTDPLSLAVIPARVVPALAPVLADRRITVLQHGIAHANHAEAGAKKIELGGRLDPAGAAAGLRAGRDRLAALFPGFRPVLVPPWNRIAPALAAALPDLGYVGLSTFAGHRAEIPGLVQINTHVDPIAWRAGGGLIGPGPAVAATVAALTTPPVGLLTHHAVHNADVWAFLADWLEVIRRHPKARLVDPFSQ